MDKQQQLEQLYADARTWMKLLPGAKQLVFGAGNPDARLIFLGEAPGRKEDEQGVPFCGAAGRILDQAFKEVELSRDEVYITAVVKSRPPNNRKPTPAEKEAGRPLLISQIHCIDPLVICTLGSTAYEALLQQKTVTIGQVRGKPFMIDNYIVVPTFHPAHFLYHKNPASMAAFLNDLALAKKLAHQNKKTHE